MKGLSLFSGAGGMDAGLEVVGVTPVGFCELGTVTIAGRAANSWTREILRRHWPDTPIHADVTTLDPKDINGPVDLVSGGSPCQDLSVAGRRQGLDGERSGLFWHQCRIADSVAAPWVLWENVRGALSSNGGADFAAVLWGLTGALPDVPDGGWRTCGEVVGPKRSAVWRVLDAQWFGVAQRRSRVFVVAGPGGQCGPEVLLEPEGLQGDSRPSRATGSPVAALTARGVGTCGADDNQAQAGHIVTALTTKCGAGLDDQQLGQLLPVPFDPTQITSAENRSNPQPGDPVHTLPAHGRPPAVVHPLAMRGRADGAELEMGEPDTYNALRAGDGGSSRANTVLTPDLHVRRLTPRECERLMSWPDDWTRWGVTESGDVVEIADAHRYRACGNGVVSPVAEWIGHRIMEAAS